MPNIQARTIESKVWGNLGTFIRVQGRNPVLSRVPLYKSSSERVYILGNGNPGGKSEGLFFLDTICDAMGFDVPCVNLAICDDYFGLPSKPGIRPGFLSRDDLAEPKMRDLTEVLQYLDFPAPFGICSSALIENSLKTAAGIFSTSFYGGETEDFYFGEEFRPKILGPLNSPYSNGAAAYYKKQGHNIIPPLPLLFSPLIFDLTPDGWHPAFSAVINTSSPGKVKVSVVPGFGLSAVGIGGEGISRTYDETFSLVAESGNMPDNHWTWHDADNQMLRSKTTQRDVVLIQRNLPRIDGLAEKADEIQRSKGFPVDIESAASSDIGRIFLYQIRRIRPKLTGINMPAPDESSVVLRTPFVIGQGMRSIDRIIAVELYGTDRSSLAFVREIDEKYPGSLMVFCADLSGGLKALFTYDQWANTAGLLFIDSANAHQFGSGLQHIALLARDEEQILFYSDNYEIIAALQGLGKRIESYEADYPSTVSVYSLPKPIHIAADDDAITPWGMIYKE